MMHTLLLISLLLPALKGMEAMLMMKVHSVYIVQEESRPLCKDRVLSLYQAGRQSSEECRVVWKWGQKSMMRCGCGSHVCGTYMSVHVGLVDQQCGLCIDFLLDLLECQCAWLCEQADCWRTAA